MYPELPLELLIPGLPVSHQTNRPRALENWKRFVGDTARASMPEGHFVLDGLLHATLYFFPQTSLGADLDNLAKPILDGLKRCVYADDNQIERLLIQRFVPKRPVIFDTWTPLLERALEAQEPLIYLRLDRASEDVA